MFAPTGTLFQVALQGGVLTPPRADMESAPTERAAMLRGV